MPCTNGIVALALVGLYGGPAGSGFRGGAFALGHGEECNCSNKMPTAILLSKFSLSVTPHNGPLVKVSPNWSPLHSHILSFFIIFEEGSMLCNDLLIVSGLKQSRVNLLTSPQL